MVNDMDRGRLVYFSSYREKVHRATIFLLFVQKVAICKKGKYEVEMISQGKKGKTRRVKMSKNVKAYGKKNYTVVVVLLLMKMMEIAMIRKGVDFTTSCTYKGKKRHHRQDQVSRVFIFVMWPL